MPYVNQIELISAILNHLDRNQGIKGMIPRHMNAIIKAADSIVFELSIEPVMATPGMGLTAWLASDDAGMSSKYMAMILSGQLNRSFKYAHPHDADDFGRCLRLLEAVPEFQSRIIDMDQCSPQWRELIRHWDEIETAYRVDDWKAANELIAKCVKDQTKP